MIFQQVSNKVIFPKEPKVSIMCKSLINKILSPLKSRIRIGGIKQDPWFALNSSDTAQSSSTTKERNVSGLFHNLGPIINVFDGRIQKLLKYRVESQTIVLSPSQQEKPES